MIFSAPMIRALFAGTKTQTRRILKPQPGPGQIAKLLQTAEIDWQILGRHGVVVESSHRFPYRSGDQIWVREAHQINAYGFDPNWTAEHIIYAADDACVELIPPVPYVGKCDIGLKGWRSPIHMPRWASRLTLTVKDVRVQRLQDISEADAVAEGLACLSKDGGRTWKYGMADRDGWPGTDNYGWPWDQWDTDPCVAYSRLWNSIHGKGAWDLNPWVSAVTFSVEHRNIDAEVSP